MMTEWSVRCPCDSDSARNNCGIDNPASPREPILRKLRRDRPSQNRCCLSPRIVSTRMSPGSRRLAAASAVVTLSEIWPKNGSCTAARWNYRAWLVLRRAVSPPGGWWQAAGGYLSQFQDVWDHSGSDNQRCHSAILNPRAEVAEESIVAKRPDTEYKGL